MIENQRGGILSKMVLIPAGVALMAGFFFLGYYVGKYQSKTNQSEIVVPLPEVVSNNLPKNSDFTFFKTLSDKENKTVSIDLKPKPSSDEKVNAGDTEQSKEKTGSAPKEKKDQGKSEVRPVPKPTEPKPQTAKKETSGRGASSKIHYTLQLASYQERAMAESDVKKMKQKGYAAFVASSQIAGKGTWYRVRLGSFTSKASAEKLQRELKAKEGTSSIITLE